jgi:hypothetical protein
LEINAFRFVPSKAFPLLGGVSRGLIKEIRYNGAIIYTNPQNSPSFFSSPREASAKLEIRRVPPGTHLTVFFEGTGLVFR